MSNVSINSQNLYDVSLNSRKSSCPSVPPPPTKKSGSGGGCVTPKRVASRTSLPTLNEHSTSVSNIPKRPGDYYIQKINSKSSLNLNKSQPPLPSSASISSVPPNYRRRLSQESVVSAHSSSSSFEDRSSIVSSQFDAPVASSSSAITSSTSRSQHSRGSQVGDSRLSSMTSTSTTDFESKVSLVDNESTSSLTKTPSNFKPQVLKAASTTNVSKSFPVPKPPPKTERSKSVTTVPTLHRTKSKFLSFQESKERQMLRKKKYEENDDDEEILSNDLDNLIFNVPVIKNNELYSLQKGSTTTLGTSKSRSNSASSSTITILSRNDLVGDDNDKYNIRPCPLPGKLSSTSHLPTLNTNNDDSIIEEDESTFDDDSEITANISDFYSHKSASVSKLMKMTREQNLMYKLPSFIKSQSSLEDLHLISPEKLNFLDQTRPINLPPKSTTDKNKHNREFTNSLSSFESLVKTQHDLRIKTVQSALLHQQQWVKTLGTLMDLDTKHFNKKFTSEKNHLRKLAWDCNVPSNLTFQFLIKILSNNYSSQDSIHTIRNSFELFDQKLQGLTEVMKQSKNREFNKIMDSVLSKPLIANSGVDMSQFKTNFIHLLYIKSMSETGLSEKDHSTIPIILTIFPDQSVIDIYCLLELINQEIFNREFISSYKPPSGETSELTFHDTFKLMLQFNDALPLSLSAPSTPIVEQGKFEPIRSDDSQESCPSHLVSPASASIEIVTKLLTLLIINSQSTKTKLKNNQKLIKSFIKTIFLDFHIGWNSYSELSKSDKSIRINNCSDQRLNVEKFVARWSSHHFG
ncbi:SBE2 [Candida metapsilosis]|uniref:SBE2 n=1 Tax=Candida metapsilosis TaxID=273372 RepID=A0A8H8DB88_9ASCO|nr:SBE2 [Candida metapsilosis]